MVIAGKSPTTLNTPPLTWSQTSGDHSPFAGETHAHKSQEHKVGSSPIVAHVCRRQKAFCVLLSRYQWLSHCLWLTEKNGILCDDLGKEQ